MKENKSFKDFVEIIAILRGENGCPWDREQTHDSLKNNLIEEAYETLEAIDSGDPHKLKEELGDILLQVLFHSRIAEEADKFNIYDVIETVKEKMVRRHPHVFGNSTAENPKEVLEQWEKIKSKEKGYEDRRSVLDGVPKELPGLIRAQVVQDKAARVGFDWDHVDQVFEKVEEEMEEFKEAFTKKDIVEMESELGDLFFALVNIARFIEVNPEEALRKTIGRFTKRFHFIEETAAMDNKSISDYSLEALNVIWEKAKKKEREK